MTQKTHTPGPWQHIKIGNCSDSNAPWKVNTIESGELKDLPETRENAQLIAAAPDMLEALVDAMQALRGTDKHATLLVVQAAIRKALGDKEEPLKGETLTATQVQEMQQAAFRKASNQIADMLCYARKYGLATEAEVVKSIGKDYLAKLREAVDKGKTEQEKL
jgi:hypothetical protein